MTEYIEFKDWDKDDFRYAEERICAIVVIQSVSAERGFGYATVQ